MLFDLLDYVQPEEGWYAITGIRGKDDVRQVLVETREDVEGIAARFMGQQRNVFFGVAKYREGGSRKKENVLALRAFWLDIDCGPGKDYDDQGSAMAALRKFCAVTGLPKPTLVDSGRGLHVYWALEENVTREQWEPVAERLRGVCSTQGLKVDDKVFEVARVLRIPGTYNFKGDEPVEVRLLHFGERISFANFCAALGTTPPVARNIFDPNYRATKEEARALSGVGYSFRRIMKRTMKGDGCAQLGWAVENRDTLGYYDWFYALSVAAMCEDGDEGVRILSESHPDYDEEAVARKVATIQKATSCAKFKSVRPELCEKCPHAGKIFGPKELGKIPKMATHNRVEVEVTPNEVEVYNIPEYPKPFYRGEGGGIWYLPPKNPLAEVEAEPMQVYKDDLYVVKRQFATGEGDYVMFRLHLKKDGIREFAVPMSKVTHKDDLRKALSQWGVTAYGKRFDLLMEYVVKSVDVYQDEWKAETMRHQFGWVDNDGKFVLGDQEITVDGNVYSPPSKVTSKLAKYIGPVGTLEEWKKVWELYGLPGMEPHAFAALSAFGAPLLKFFNQTGAVINLYNSRSGTGKTTVLNMANSVYGHPKELRLKLDDTMNGRLLWVGILNNLPATMDELTNATPKEYSDFLYALSNGKGKERMMAGSNELRENNTTWQTITISTSNASFAEKLSVLKNNPEGELMRLFEYPVGLVDMADNLDTKRLFDTVLFQNYGHAGPIFLRYVLNNLERVKLMCTQVQAKIDRELGLLPKERFWSATIAANIVGAVLAKKCNLINWDLDRVYDWACGQVMRLRNETTPPLLDVQQIIADYMYRNMQNILVVDDLVDRRSKAAHIPKREPKGELRIRIEPDAKMMYFIAKPFKDYCVQYQINYNETLSRLEKEGRLVERKAKRVAKGMNGIVGAAIHCLWFKIDDEFVNVGDYTQERDDDT